MILITGTTGFVGRKLANTMKDAVCAPSLRNASREDIRRIIEESGADTIIHTAAIADMGECEKDPEASYYANVLIPLYLAEAAKDRKLVCFSSDQVYNGSAAQGPYQESDVQPNNVYAKHKLEMENRVLDILPSAVMLRAEWMYDMESAKGNYLKNLLAADKSVSFGNTEYRGITYLQEVADNMEKVILLPGGAYNFGSETDRTMYDITKQFVAALGKEIEVLEAPAKHNLWMDCSKAKAHGVEFSDTLEGLLKCAKDYKLLAR